MQDVKTTNTARREEAHSLTLPYEHQAWTNAYFLIPNTLTVSIFMMVKALITIIRQTSFQLYKTPVVSHIRSTSRTLSCLWLSCGPHLLEPI